MAEVRARRDAAGSADIVVQMLKQIDDIGEGLAACRSALASPKLPDRANTDRDYFWSDHYLQTLRVEEAKVKDRFMAEIYPSVVDVFEGLKVFVGPADHDVVTLGRELQHPLTGAFWARLDEIYRILFVLRSKLSLR